MVGGQDVEPAVGVNVADSHAERILSNGKRRAGRILEPQLPIAKEDRHAVVWTADYEIGFPILIRVGDELNPRAAPEIYGISFSNLKTGVPFAIKNRQQPAVVVPHNNFSAAVIVQVADRDPA